MNFIKDFMKKEEDDDEERKVEQEDVALDITKEMAGVIFAVEQLVKSEEMKLDRAINLLRIFFEIDTGEILHANHIRALLRHQMVLDYIDRVQPNIEKRKKRLSQWEFQDSPEDIVQEKPRWQQREEGAKASEEQPPSNQN